MDITDLALFLCKTDESICETNYECTNCDLLVPATSNFTYYLNLQRSDLHITDTDSIASILGRLFNLETSRQCTNCNDVLYKNTYFTNAPELLILYLPYTDVKINTSFKFCNKIYTLKGIVYYGDNHYTSYVISENTSIWYHDGIQTGKNMMFEGDILSHKYKKWNKYNDKNAVLYIYICI